MRTAALISRLKSHQEFFVVSLAEWSPFSDFVGRLLQSAWLNGLPLLPVEPYIASSCMSGSISKPGTPGTLLAAPLSAFRLVESLEWFSVIKQLRYALHRFLDARVQKPALMGPEDHPFGPPLDALSSHYRSRCRTRLALHRR
jgi:hypothetical protein